MNLELRQIDFNTAFLNAPISSEKDVYVRPIPGADQRCPKGFIYRLKKAVYGRRESPKEWWILLRDTIIGLGWNQSLVDQCLFFRGSESDNFEAMVVYVDDIVIASSNPESSQRIIDALASKFALKDVGNATSLLGLHITRNRDRQTIDIDQSALSLRYLEKFYNSHNPEVTVNLTTEEYREQLGCLSYLANSTRPDIAYDVNHLARKITTFGIKECQHLRAVWKDLKATYKYKLKIDGSKPLDITTFTDSDWGGDHEDRVSISGAITYLSGAPITWTSKKQPCVALSTMEAKTIALTVGCQDALWLSELLTEILKPKQSIPIRVKCDNQATVKYSQSLSNHPAARHISIKFLFIRRLFNDRPNTTLSYVPTTANPSDILTKRTLKSKKAILRAILGIIDTKFIPLRGTGGVTALPIKGSTYPG